MICMQNNPCRFCTKETGRYIGCHDHCPKRAEAVKEHQAVKDAISKEKKRNYDLNSVSIEGRARWKRAHGCNSIKK